MVNSEAFSPESQKVEEIGHVQERPRICQEGRISLGHGQELVEAVDLHELYAGLAVYLFTGDHIEGLLQHAIRAPVPIVVWVAKQAHHWLPAGQNQRPRYRLPD